ncbi:MAG: hypothetical protein KDB53_03835 [Planctomycetes bacterium]|nr:hypothetical protein [Planctomycetota bacterium]
MRTRLVIMSILAAGLTLATASAQESIFDLSGGVQSPPNWFAFPEGGSLAITIEKDGARRLTITPPAAANRFYYLREVAADRYRGHAVRLRARLRLVEALGEVRLGMSVELANGRRGFYDPGQDQALRGTDWIEIECVGGVADDAANLRLQLECRGGAVVEVRSIQLEDLGALGEEGRPVELLEIPRRHLANTLIREETLLSPLLSAYFGRPVSTRSGVVLPPGWTPDEDLPIAYTIHGFGGDHRAAWQRGPELQRLMKNEGYPRLIHVFLDASCAMGHHEFADSFNNGPRGRALTEEFIPWLEARLGGRRRPDARFLTGHSSGGWSSLWLQVQYPEIFGGTWSTAPDPVDFRDFTGIDIYRFDNAYRDPDGKVVQLIRRGDEWVQSLEQFAREEAEANPIGGQFASFDAVFSPRGPDGRPMQLFDRETGSIDPEVAEAWKRYDIRLILRDAVESLRPALAGKIHVWCGTRDTFRLEGAVKLLKDELRHLNYDAEILLVPGRDHGDLFAPHDDFWPEGMLARIHGEMRARFDASRTK